MAQSENNQTNPAPRPAVPQSAPKAAPVNQAKSTSNGKTASGDPVKQVPTVKANVAPASSKKNTLALSPLQALDWKPGCGCRFYKPTNLKEEGPLLLRLDDNKKAILRFDAGLQQFQLADEQHVLKKPPKILAHDRMMLKFKGTDASASFSGSVERNCVKFNDSCKAVSYQGVLTVAQEGKQGSFPVWGTCGC